jgi:light-regulated signal transduction histidine kinase (bacteriophytochrome)
MVASFTQLLEKRYEGQLDDDADEFIGFIVEGAQRMKNLIDDLLAFSRLNTTPIKFEYTKLNTVLDEVLSDLKNSIDENNALITSDSLPIIWCDPLKIRQLFQNLISNASNSTKKNHLKYIYQSRNLRWMDVCGE